MPQPHIDAPLQLVEEGNALADQLDLLEVVELEPKSTRGDGRGEGGQCWPFFQDDRLQTGALGEKRGRAADDATADDDEVGGLGR
jgi:hypothetical protein